MYGECAIPFIHYDASDFHDGLASTYWNGNWGYINKKGEQIIEHKYKRAYDFSESVAWVQNDEGYFGAIDKQGNEIISFSYAVTGGCFIDGIAYVGKGAYGDNDVLNRVGAIDKDENVVIPFVYSLRYDYNGDPVLLDADGNHVSSK